MCNDVKRPFKDATKKIFGTDLWIHVTMYFNNTAYIFCDTSGNKI